MQTKNTETVVLMNPVEVEVTKSDPQKLPRRSLAFAYEHCGAYRALVVDMSTWGVHSIVEGSREELVEIFARKHESAGLLFISGTGPMSDIVVPVGGGRPGGGGGPRGWPPPLVLAVVEAVSRVARQY